MNFAQRTVAILAIALLAAPAASAQILPGEQAPGSYVFDFFTTPAAVAMKRY